MVTLPVCITHWTTNLTCFRSVFTLSLSHCVCPVDIRKLFWKLILTLNTIAFGSCRKSEMQLYLAPDYYYRQSFDMYIASICLGCCYEEYLLYSPKAHVQVWLLERRKRSLQLKAWPLWPREWLFTFRNVFYVTDILPWHWACTYVLYSQWVPRIFVDIFGKATK